MNELLYLNQQDRLFKEFGLVNLEKYKQNKIAIRWRIEQEVLNGKGQFKCGNLKCDESEGLKSWEVPFSYLEKEVKKVALVKLKLCSSCSVKLNYNKIKEEKRRKSRRIDDEKQESCHEDDVKRNRNEINDHEDGIVNENNVSDQESELWKAPITITQDQDDEDFDSYLNDMFM